MASEERTKTGAGARASDAPSSTKPPRVLGADPLLHPGATVANCRLGRYTEIGEGARLLNVDFDDYSYCDRFADLANAGVGKFVSIASYVRLNPGDHPLERASLHHFMYRASMYWPDAEDEPEIFRRRASKRVAIGHDAWIGSHAIVLAGRAMGVGAALGAGAVLTKDMGPYEIWAGNPARKIRDRVPDRLKDRLIALAWWDWPHERMRAALDDFRALEADAFVEKYGG